MNEVVVILRHSQFAQLDVSPPNDVTVSVSGSPKVFQVSPLSYFPMPSSSQA